MNENISKMLELLSQDEETMKKLSAIHDPDEAYALVSSIHGGYTKEEFIETMTAINDSINQDIDAEDLSTAAGGGKVEEAAKGAAASAAMSAAASVGMSLISSASAASAISLVSSAAGVGASVSAVAAASAV